MNHRNLELLKAAVENRDFILIVGTGVSAALNNSESKVVSWRGLINAAFEYAHEKALLSTEQKSAWESQLNSSDIDELLSAAEFVGRKLNAPTGDLYARWLERAFKDIPIRNERLKNTLGEIHRSGVPFCTLNYDHLLEGATGASAILLSDVGKTTAWMRRELTGILHLHGSWDSPSSCILGIRDYEATLGDGIRELVQRNMAVFRRMIFLGCGDTFADPNFSTLVRWLRTTMKTAAPQHFALVRNSEVPIRNADVSWQGFVEPVGYGNNHHDLSDFLEKWFRTPPHKKAPKRSAKATRANVAQANLLNEYRAFLVRDCGQMTIEGVRADLEIGQRRFDLERLFVPLKIGPCPPEFKRSDPKAQQKLRKWQEKNAITLSFGKVFSKIRKIALLALPGGGKTLLLKRLTVAYAQPSRRTTTSDNLPKFDLTPVLVRCREWREHIKKPILTLLQNLPEITGQPQLAGLDEAILPLLKNGKVLLLVDGLDEIHDDADRTSFVENLEKFLDEFPKIRLVVTSREAGFSLVAPCISRFCQRWRIAPLEDTSIRLLCEYWRRLMIGDSPEAIQEMTGVADQLTRNSSRKSLAENPLLLTMLLVVKHGAGRLPPDRVSLYGRAVEVLLDTWNIKGHAALNLKESVPQLACIAFELFKAGKQTATEKELLELLEKAREKLAHIRRYAKDTPHEFLKRVELRSSLLLEAGHQVEGGRTVPFYQFRHLTFQEYLTAVAAAEGHYLSYETGDSLLKPLRRCLVTNEWKEVIPMAAVVARKQAEPLIVELIKQSRSKKAGSSPKKRGQPNYPKPLPAAVNRLVQCLSEEAEAAPKTITEALKLIAFFGSAREMQMDWRVIGRGPYGPELFHHVWSQFSKLDEKKRVAWNPCAEIAAAAWSKKIVDDKKIDPDLAALLESSDDESVGHGLFVIAGTFLNEISSSRSSKDNLNKERVVLIEVVEKHLGSKSPGVITAAIWALFIMMYRSKARLATTTLDRFLSLWTNCPNKILSDTASTALWGQTGLAREYWHPRISAAQASFIREQLRSSPKHSFQRISALVVAFHARCVWKDTELAKRLRLARKDYFPGTHRRDPIGQMLKQLRLGRRGK